MLVVLLRQSSPLRCERAGKLVWTNKEGGEKDEMGYETCPSSHASPFLALPFYAMQNVSISVYQEISNPCAPTPKPVARLIPSGSDLRPRFTPTYRMADATRETPSPPMMA